MYIITDVRNEGCGLSYKKGLYVYVGTYITCLNFMHKPKVCDMHYQ